MDNSICTLELYMRGLYTRVYNFSVHVVASLEIVLVVEKLFKPNPKYAELINYKQQVIYLLYLYDKGN